MYCQHFGLRETPFGLTPDTDFVYEDGQHQSALETLRLALDSGEGFVKVTGEVGTGKTLLCRRLLASLPAHAVTAYLFNPCLGPAALLRALAAELGLTGSPQDDAHGEHDEHGLYLRLQRELLRWADQGRPVVCCIDEAQALPPASLQALRMLSNLETRKRKLIQVALFGQPELDVMLRSHELRSLASRMAFGAQLGGLSWGDFKSYLAHRLSVAGWAGAPVFSNAALWLLWRQSGGVPRSANVLAHQCLMLAYGRGSHHVGLPQAWLVCRERWRLFAPSTHRRPLRSAFQGDRP